MERAVAIVGMACRLPGANSLAEFWSLLAEGRETVGEIPRSRFDADALFDRRPGVSGKIYTRRGGFIDDIASFDNALFNVSPREALRMDPQQRLLLQLTWEALDDAGWRGSTTEARRTGVFVGAHANDYAEVLLTPDLLDVYATTGGDRSFLAGRVAFAFGFEGPCLTLDAACASSLSAVHLALQSLRSGECRLALAAGVNLLLRPRGFISLCQGGILAADGRCKFADDSADGFVRSEGAGVVVLKPLADALADRDRIYAVVRGSALSSNGARSATLMTPSVDAYRELLARAFEDAQVAAGDVEYVEVHGAATRVGDPLEIQAVGEAIAATGSARRCALGSVKTNIGHTEAASGIAGLMKVALALHHGVLPASLHFSTPNRAVPWDTLPVRVQTRTEDWPGQRRIAGVSSYGLSGGNAHVVLAGAAPAPGALTAEGEEGACVLTLSAASPQALRTTAERFVHELACERSPWSDVCYTASARRRHYRHRLALCASSAAEAARELAAHLAGEASHALHVGQAGDSRQAVFVFSGHGSQWKGMGQQLLLEPASREALLACDRALRPHVGWSLLDELARPGPGFRNDKLDFVQPAIFSLQVACAALWRAWGVLPRAVVGHSMGEVAAAHVAGALSLEDAARVISLRSAIMRRAPGDTAMAVVDLPFAAAREAVASFADRVAVAVESGPESCVLSGDRALIEAFLVPLRERGVFCRYVNVDVAGHSPQLRAVIPEMREALAGITPRSQAVPYYSAVMAERIAPERLDTEYWIRNVVDPVRFWTAISRACDEGATSFLEISPHPITLTSLRQGFAQSGRDVVTFGSLVREQDERVSMRRTLAALYTSGHDADWGALVPAESRVVSLPAYPFEGRSFWPQGAQTSKSARQLTSDSLLGERVPLAGAQPVQVFESLLTSTSPAFLEGHRFQGDVLLSSSAYVEMALAAGRELLGEVSTIRGLSLPSPLVLGDEPRRVQVLFRAGGQRAQVQVYSALPEPDAEWTLHAELSLARGARATPACPVDAVSDAMQEISEAEHYARLAARGLELTGAYRAVARVWGAPGTSIGELAPCEETRAQASRFVVHPALLDACFQVSAHALPDSDAVWLASGIEELAIDAALSGSERVVATAQIEGDVACVQLSAFDAAGRAVLRVQGLRLTRLRAAEPRPAPGGLECRAAVLAAAPEQRADLARERLADMVAQVLGQRRSELPLDVPLNRLGLDSLMAVELRRRLEREAAMAISTVKFLQGPTVVQLGAWLLESMERDEQRDARAASEPALAEAAPVPHGALSWNQRALAFIHELAPASAAYHYGFTARVCGKLDVTAFRAAVGVVTARHSALHSAFVVEGGEMSAVGRSSWTFEWRLTDAQGWSESALREALAREFHEPFSLREPPLRVSVFSGASTGDVISITLHHIIIDFASLVVVLEELAHAYAAAATGEPPRLPAVTADYPEFVAWQQRWLSSAEGARSREYWVATLAGTVPLDLASDRPRPALQTYRGDTHFRPLPAELVAALQQLAQESATTLHTVLLAGFLAALHRHSAQSDIVVGTYSSGRSQGRFERTVGDLVNPLPIRVQFSDIASFRALLARVREAMLGALEHADYPLPLMIDALRLPRDASRSPLFQTVFVLQQASSMPALHPFTDGRAGGRLRLGPLELESIEVPQYKARFDLELMVLAEASGRYSALAQYNSDLFDARSVERLVGTYFTLLEAIAAQAEVELAALPVIGATDWAAAERELNATQAEYPRATVPQLFSAAAQEFASKTALVDAQGAMSYRELAAAVSNVSAQLRARGIASGAHVGVLLERSRDLVVTLLALLRAGAVYVPLDPIYPQERSAFILQDSGAAFALTSGALADQFAGFRGQVLQMEQLYEDCARCDEPEAIDFEAGAYLLYTSGSTGRPKGVRVAHRSLTNLLWSMKATPGATHADVWVAVTTVSFDIAALELFLPLIVGATLVLASRATTLDGVALAGLLADTRATVLQATPITFRMLVDAGWRGHHDFKILCGGEALPPELAAALLDRGRVFNLYGPTETTIWSLVHPLTRSDLGQSIPIGRPVANTRVYVVDAELRPVPLGAIGELLIAGDGVAEGYHGRPELTRERFVRPHWLAGERAYRTGDRVRLRGDGVLEFLGRADTQVKIRGYRVELGEIDAALGTYPALRESVTVLHERPGGVPELVAYVVSDVAVDEPALRSHLRRSLPDYMIPGWFEQLPALPRTPNNKIDRRALPAPSHAGRTSDVEREPRSDAERLVADVWAELLGRRSFDLHSNFFDVGGSSFLIARARALIAERSGKELPLVDMYQHTTVQGLARLLAEPARNERAAQARRRAEAQRAALASASRRQS